MLARRMPDMECHTLTRGAAKPLAQGFSPTVGARASALIRRILASPQDRQERVNVNAGGQAVVGTVTHQSHGGTLPETLDQTYGTEHERTRQPATDAPACSQEAGRPALPEAQCQGAELVQAARRRSRQRRTKG